MTPVNASVDEHAAKMPSMPLEGERLSLDPDTNFCINFKLVDPQVRHVSSSEPLVL